MRPANVSGLREGEHGRGFPDRVRVAHGDVRRGRLRPAPRLATDKRGVGDTEPLLRAVSDTDFLQTVTLLTSYDARQRWDERVAGNGEAEGSDGRPPVSCKRRDVLRLTLKDYAQWREAAVHGYEAAGRLLMSQFFFAPKDLPYRTQLVPLAAILAVVGQEAEAEAVKAQLRRWYWCGVFGEFYGSATETRFARDLPEVVAWVRGGAEPDTVAQASFAPGRLHTLRSRQSAAYKGLHALLMRDGARDFRTGDTIQIATYFDDQVDIHHVFPQGWTRSCARTSSTRRSSAWTTSTRSMRPALRSCCNASKPPWASRSRGNRRRHRQARARRAWTTRATLPPTVNWPAPEQRMNSAPELS